MIWKAATGGAVLALVMSGAAQAACAPPGMVKIVARAEGPDVTGFNAEPKVLYRSGARHLRVEEAPDPANGLHMIIVVSEPDIWFVNQFTRTGQHIVDPGPTFEVHAPVLDNVSGVLGELEFGCESDFARSHAPKPERTISFANGPAEVRLIKDGDRTLELLFRPGGATPLRATYSEPGKPIVVLRFVTYETGLAFDSKLFERLEGYAYSEERPGTENGP